MITQDEANYLLNLHKQRLDETRLQFPLKGSKLSIQLESCDKKLYFLLDINNTPNLISKITYQTRNIESIILVRLDINGAHRNPFVNEPPLPQFKPYNGQSINGTHIHFYVERFKDSWAIPLNAINSDIKDDYELLNYFYSLCAIVKPPILEYGFAI